MKSYEAIQKAVDGKTIEHAKALHKSTSLVHKWQEPSADYTDSGSHNPLDRIETIIRTSLSLGNQPDIAFAPIQYLAEQFNLALIPIVHVKYQHSDLRQELLKTVAEFGDLAKAASQAMKDSKLTKREAAYIQKEGWDLIRQAVAFVEKVKETAK